MTLYDTMTTTKSADYQIHFDNNDFRDEFIRELSSDNIQPDDLTRFTNISKTILENKAPSKERYVRYNQVKFMNKILQKAIMNPSRLLNRYRKEKTEATKYRSGFRKGFSTQHYLLAMIEKLRKSLDSGLQLLF